MCNCITTVEKDAAKAIEPLIERKYRSKVVGKAELKNVSFRLDPVPTVVTHSILAVKVEKRKRLVEQILINSYCPFCGEKYMNSNSSKQTKRKTS